MGRMKHRREKQEERKQDMIWTPGMRKQNRGEIPTPREAPSLIGELVGTEEKHLQLSEEGEVADLRQIEQIQWPCMPILGWCSLVHMGAGRWSVDIREKIQGEDCCWFWGDSLRGWEGRNPK